MRPWRTRQPVPSTFLWSPPSPLLPPLHRLPVPPALLLPASYPLLGCDRPCCLPSPAGGSHPPAASLPCWAAPPLLSPPHLPSALNFLPLMQLPRTCLPSGPSRLCCHCAHMLTLWPLPLMLPLRTYAYPLAPPAYAATAHICSPSDPSRLCCHCAHMLTLWPLPLMLPLRTYAHPLTLPAYAATVHMLTLWPLPLVLPLRTNAHPLAPQRLALPPHTTATHYCLPDCLTALSCC